jgi:hypothetical protein
MHLDKQTTDLRTTQLGLATALISAAANVVTATSALAKSVYEAFHQADDTTVEAVQSAAGREHHF